MAVLSFIMALVFAVSTCFIPMAWHRLLAGAVALAVMFLCAILAIVLGFLAMVRMLYVDRSLKGMPYAFAGIVVPLFYFLRTMISFWRG